VGLVVEVFLLEVHIAVEAIEVVEEDMHRTRMDFRMQRPTHNYEIGRPIFSGIHVIQRREALGTVGRV
jgi:hypothetical protein